MKCNCRKPSQSCKLLELENTLEFIRSAQEYACKYFITVPLEEEKASPGF